MSGYSKSKRTKRDIEPEEESEEEERMPYFVPEEGIDIEPLALYTRSILDDEAKVKLGNHPQRTNEKGFWIISSVPVSREDIAAMIEDTRLWNRENKKGHYVNSDTAKRRLRIGRAAQGRERVSKAQPRSTREREPEDDPRYARQSVSRASIEPDPRGYMPPPPVTRASADNVLDRTRGLPTATPSPRPASAAPIPDPRRPSNNSQYAANPGYIQATAQYTVQANIPQQAQYSSYGNDAAMYDTTPPPYSSDNKRERGPPPGSNPGGGHPSNSGTQGFQSMYATSGGPPAPRAPNSGQRRQG